MLNLWLEIVVILSMKCDHTVILEEANIDIIIDCHKLIHSSHEFVQLITVHEAYPSAGSITINYSKFMRITRMKKSSLLPIN